MNSKVSIVIPTYNSGSLLDKAISSVIQQSVNDYELIVVDDGSNDDTLRRLQKYGNRITVIAQANAGASRARNTGIKAATGEYIAFLDADDLWRPKKLAEQIKAMQSHPEWVACYTSTCFEAVEENRVDDDADDATLTSKNLQQIFSYPYLVTSSFLIRREVLARVGSFDEKLKTAEDIDLYLRVAEQGLIGHIEKSLVWKGDIEGSLGSTFSSYEDNLTVIDAFLARQHDKPYDWSKLAAAVKAKIYREWGKDLLWNQQPVPAIKVLLCSLRKQVRLDTSMLIVKSLLNVLTATLRSKK